jgi:hypothetical protein
VELDGLRERSLTGLVGRTIGGIERAHLKPDAACAEVREPVARERIGLVAPEDELQREVVVSVGDQRPYVPTSVATASGR